MSYSYMSTYLFDFNFLLFISLNTSISTAAFLKLIINSISLPSMLLVFQGPSFYDII